MKIKYFFRFLPFFFLFTSGVVFATSFTDSDLIPEWAKTSVETLQTRKIMTGFSDGTFRPKQSITRAEALAILFRAKGVDTQNSSINKSFSDVPVRSWFFLLVQKAFELDITKGFDDGTFRPEQPVTRAEFSVFVQRLYGLQKAEGTSDSLYVDVSSKDWFYNSVYALRDNGLVREKTPSFHPSENLSRADAAWIIATILSKPRLTGESKTNDFSKSIQRSARRVAIKPRNLKTGKQGYDIARQEVLGNAEALSVIPSITLKSDWTPVGVFRFTDTFDMPVQIHSFNMKFRFENSSIGPVSNFQVKIVDPQSKEVILDVGLDGTILYGGRKDLIRPSENIVYQIQVKPVFDRTYFAKSGKGSVIISELSASLLAATTAEAEQGKNYRTAPWTLQNKNLTFQFSLGE